MFSTHWAPAESPVLQPLRLGFRWFLRFGILHTEHLQTRDIPSSFGSRLRVAWSEPDGGPVAEVFEVFPNQAGSSTAVCCRSSTEVP